MNWNTYVDLYCERLKPGFWDEPLNAISNLAFCLAAAWVYRQWALQHVALKRMPDASAHQLRRWDINSLLLSLLLIGAGSFAFHTFATRWAGALDVLFIVLYLHFYLAVYLHRAMQVRWPLAWLGVPAFLLLSQTLNLLWQQLAVLLANSIFSLGGAASGYMAAWTVLLMLALHSSIKRLPSAKPLVMAAACFALSLALRQLDLPLCSEWPWGLHFAWHLLNACTLGLTSWAMVRMAHHAR